MVGIIKHIILLILLLAMGKSSVAQLAISPGSSITIKEGTSFYVGTNLYIKSDASGSGYLADQNAAGDCTITGDKTVERYLTANGWHNTASPVSNASSSVFTGTDLIFYYDETIILNDWNFGWVWYEGSLAVMKGYDLYLSSAITANYTATGGESLNTGSYNIAITRTDVANGEAENRKGWNLIGNPYPSPVDWLVEAGWDKSDINDAKYIWNPTNNNYTIFLGGGSPTGVNEGTQYIPSNQGFWVQATQNGSIHINNTTRLGIMTLTPDYYKNPSGITQELRLIASGNGYTDETMIRFLAESTPEFDINIDASKLFSAHDSVPQICTKAGNTLLAINSYPEIIDNLGIEVNFNCSTAGYYTIAIDDHSTIDAFDKVYLKDIKEQKIINLSSEQVYRFYHEPRNINSRFTVYFNPSEETIKNTDPEYFTVSTYKNTLTINNNNQLSGVVSIYNMHGQIISSFPLNENNETCVSLKVSSGYYIASIVTDSRISNSKIRITH